MIEQLDICRPTDTRESLDAQVSMEERFSDHRVFLGRSSSTDVSSADTFFEPCFLGGCEGDSSEDLRFCVPGATETTWSLQPAFDSGGIGLSCMAIGFVGGPR